MKEGKEERRELKKRDDVGRVGGGNREKGIGYGKEGDRVIDGRRRIGKKGRKG